jgi:hypothetical protein
MNTNNETGVIIANPIYDTAFKKLMGTDKDADRENARYFIGTILGEEITEIDYLPQEYSYHSNKTNKKSESEFESEVQKLKLMRLDFTATIRTCSGEKKRLLIEIQRSSDPLDLLRFRGYIGEQYLQNEKIEPNVKPEDRGMPIVIIYMLGFNLKKIDTIAMRVNRTYVDLIDPAGKFDKNPYVECLSHDCYFIQAARINAAVYADFDKCSELVQMLSVFEKDYFAEENKKKKTYRYTITNKNIKKMIETLEYIAADPVMRKIMIEEYWASQNERIWKSQVETLTEENAAQSNKIEAQSNKIEALSDSNAKLSDKKAAQSNRIAELERQLQQLSELKKPDSN